MKSPLYELVGILREDIEALSNKPSKSVTREMFESWDRDVQVSYIRSMLTVYAELHAEKLGGLYSDPDIQHNFIFTAVCRDTDRPAPPTMISFSLSDDRTMADFRVAVAQAYKALIDNNPNDDLSISFVGYNLQNAQGPRFVGSEPEDFDTD